MRRIKSQRIVVFSLVVLAVVIFFESAIVFGYFDTLSIWLQIVGALFGVVLSAIITMLLLSGQSRNALEKERSAEIFREKLRIYQEYLHRLCDILRDGEITSEEAIELQFLTSYISLHTDSKNIKEICVNTSNMVSNYIGEHAQKSTQVLLANLYEIVRVFREELYASGIEWSEKDIKGVIEHLLVLEHVAAASNVKV